MYGPLKTRQRFAASVTGLQGMGQYGPYDTTYDNGYGPDMDTPPPTSQSGAPGVIALTPVHNEWWVPQPSAVAPPGVNPVLVLGIIVGGLFFFGAGARA